MPSAYLHIINWLEQHQLPCLFRLSFHIDCPGCGLQRSAIALLRGQVWQSLQLYPALLPLLLFFIFLIINRSLQYRFSTKYTHAGLAMLFVIILASYIYKITNHQI